jgi:hypothetical protein
VAQFCDLRKCVVAARAVSAWRRGVPLPQLARPKLLRLHAVIASQMECACRRNLSLTNPPLVASPRAALVEAVVDANEMPARSEALRV